MEAIVAYLCVCAFLAILSLLLFSFCSFLFNHVRTFRNSKTRMLEDSQSPFDIIDRYKKEDISERIKNVKFLYQDGGMVDKVVNSEKDLHILYTRLDYLEKQLNWESKLFNVLIEALLVSILASAVFLDSSAGVFSCSVRLIVILFVYLTFYTWWYFKDNKVSIELNSVRSYERRLLQEKIRKWEDAIKVDEKYSRFYNTKMHILNELLIEERGERKSKVDKRETQKHIEIVKKWNVSKYDMMVDKYIIVSVAGESFWFPGKEKDICEKNEQAEVFLTEEDMQIYIILMDHDLMERKAMNRSAILENEKQGKFRRRIIDIARRYSNIIWRRKFKA